MSGWVRPVSLLMTDDEIEHFGKGGYPDWGRVRVTLQTLKSRWDFEHALAVDQEREVKRLDSRINEWSVEVDVLKAALREAREVLNDHITGVDGLGEDYNDEAVLGCLRRIATVLGPDPDLRRELQADMMVTEGWE